MINRNKISSILKWFKSGAITVCLLLIISTLSYASNSKLNEREYDPNQAYSNGISAQPEIMPEYLLDVSDVIEVVVWRNEDLSRVLKIRPDGRISLPLAGEIKASGLTPQQLSDLIAATLERKYILNPQVTVIVQKVESKTILVLGHVNKPGQYSISEKVTALQAIAKAGGNSQFGHMESVVVVRNAYAMKPAIYNINLQKSMNEANFSNDMALQPGDIVYVPKNFLGKIDDVMGFFRLNIQPTLSSYLQYRTLEAVEDNN
ncbi:MAG: polysaccharide biosynthesis/export family protein [Candidatus Omnitrophica bacterium]|nr:polysaccharide biosynthesis/export family protein [Candidatus Omnitrophota bacterium]